MHKPTGVAEKLLKSKKRWLKKKRKKKKKNAKRKRTKRESKPHLNRQSEMLRNTQNKLL